MSDDKHYVNEIGTEIIVDCGQDVSSATTTKLEVRKPDGTLAEWDATIYETDYLKYLTVAGDFDQAGLYAIQPYLVLPTWTGRGETVTFYVFGNYDDDY